MRLFDAGESVQEGLKLHLDEKANKVFLPIGSPKSERYIKLRAARSLVDGPGHILEASLDKDKYGVDFLGKPRAGEDSALIRVCVASTPGIPIRYELDARARFVMGGVFNAEPAVPMYLIEMQSGGSFRWQRGHDGVVYTWNGTLLHERRGTELPS